MINIIQIITKMTLNWISGILQLKSYIKNELKHSTKSKKYVTTVRLNRGPEARAIPLNH